MAGLGGGGWRIFLSVLELPGKRKVWKVADDSLWCKQKVLTSTAFGTVVWAMVVEWAFD